MNLYFSQEKVEKVKRGYQKNILRAEGSGVIQGGLNRMHVGSAEGCRIVAFMMQSVNFSVQEFSNI